MGGGSTTTPDTSGYAQGLGAIGDVNRTASQGVFEQTVPHYTNVNIGDLNTEYGQNVALDQYKSRALEQQFNPEIYQADQLRKQQVLNQMQGNDPAFNDWAVKRGMMGAINGGSDFIRPGSQGANIQNLLGFEAFHNYQNEAQQKAAQLRAENPALRGMIDPQSISNIRLGLASEKANLDNQRGAQLANLWSGGAQNFANTTNFAGQMAAQNASNIASARNQASQAKSGQMMGLIGSGIGAAAMIGVAA